MKKVLSYLTMLSLLVVLVFVPVINTKAAQSRTFNIGRVDIGTAVSYPLGLRLETPSAFTAQNLGGGLQLVDNGNGMLVVSGTTNSYGTINTTVNGVRCLVNPSDQTSGDTFDLVISFVVAATPSATSHPYRVNYVEKATNNVILTEEGVVNADNSWVNIRTEFHYSGSDYRIEPVQAYPGTQYSYATASNAAQVRVMFANTGADGYVTFNIVSVKKPETSIASPSNSSSSAPVTSTRSVRQGWILNNGEWYYYVGGVRTNLKRGWHKDSQDGFWYYLNGADGRMLKGWNLINDEWYYLAPYTPMQTWELRSDGEWYYMHKENSRPLGSMYSGGTTPDGYRVDSDGKYVK